MNVKAEYFIKLSNFTQINAIQLLSDMINGANMKTQLADNFWDENYINYQS